MKNGFFHRYARNLGVISETEQQFLAEKSVCVIGCGGLGGGIIENLTRLGVGRLTIVDGDVFDVTNLNRQVLSNEMNVGKRKAEMGAMLMREVNSEVKIHPVHTLVDESNCRDIIRDHDVVVDALDNVQTRLILEGACEAEGIPLVHGAIAGWTGQVAVVMPGDKLLSRVYGCEESLSEGITEEPLGNPSFTPAIIAGIQTAEVVKLLLDRPGALKNKLLMVDVLEHEYETIDFGA